MEDTIRAYPLSWPSSQKRTKRPYSNPRFSRKHSALSTCQNIISEINLMGGRKIIISTNIRLRMDGLPYSNQRSPKDTGVAVYFNFNEEQKCIANDQWDKVEHNLHSVARTLHALRQISRDGGSTLFKSAFRGFKALPEPEVPKPWYIILEVNEEAGTATVLESFERLAKKKHPDVGGSDHEMRELLRARKEYLACRKHK